MVEVNISELAYTDLLEIEAYIGQSSPSIARNFINKIFNRIEILYDFPESGRIVPELNDKNVRELILGNYRIVYQLNSEIELVVLRVIHGKRLLDLS